MLLPVCVANFQLHLLAELTNFLLNQFKVKNNLDVSNIKLDYFVEFIVGEGIIATIINELERKMGQILL